MTNAPPWFCFATCMFVYLACRLSPSDYLGFPSHKFWLPTVALGFREVPHSVMITKVEPLENFTPRWSIVALGWNIKARLLLERG